MYMYMCVVCVGEHVCVHMYIVYVSVVCVCVHVYKCHMSVWGVHL